MWYSSALMSGSPFCRQAATIAPTLTGGRALAILGAGTGSFHKNGGASVFIGVRLRASRTRSR
jgi:hypothetical protein